VAPKGSRKAAVARAEAEKEKAVVLAKAVAGDPEIHQCYGAPLALRICLRLNFQGDRLKKKAACVNA
jgi:hypothetical protein